MPVLDVVSYLSGLLGESVEVRTGGQHGYTETFVIGPVMVWSSPERPECCIEVTGSACEVLGLRQLAVIYFGLALRPSRLDLAVDGCDFTPRQLRAEWMKHNVRSAARVPDEKALVDRGLRLQPAYEGVRSCKWDESPTGSTFRMGSRSSSQLARCYDSRGFTRFELELKGRRAAAAAVPVFEQVEDPERFAGVVLALVRDFVDFVDVGEDSNPSRAPLLPFWQAFCGAVARARLTLEGVAARTLAEALAWFEHAIAPVYALLLDGFGPAVLGQVATGGRKRWGTRHRRMLAGAAVPA